MGGTLILQVIFPSFARRILQLTKIRHYSRPKMVVGIGTSSIVPPVASFLAHPMRAWKSRISFKS
jgi:NAD-dependent SIR2 family protein deacetylase